LPTAVCGKARSLRDKIVNDKKLSEYGFSVESQHKRGRQHGWAKLKSDNRYSGALNIEWDGDTKILMCRIVNRGRGTPGAISGDFLRYLLEQHYHRITVVNVIPE